VIRILLATSELRQDRRFAYGAAGRQLRIRGRALPDGASERHAVGARHIEDALAVDLATRRAP
jgi:hypothetical protein